VLFSQTGDGAIIFREARLGSLSVAQRSAVSEFFWQKFPSLCLKGPGSPQKFPVRFHREFRPNL
jgi:hypothetical protein